MSSSDDPDTNTSDKCVSGERNRECENVAGLAQSVECLTAEREVAVPGPDQYSGS